MKRILLSFTLLAACGGTDVDLPDATVETDAAIIDAGVPDVLVLCGRVDFPCCPGDVCLDVAFSECDVEQGVCVRRPDAAP